MKKLFFSVGIVLLSLSCFSQTSYPCTLSFDVLNNGNGGQGCPSTHPDNANYQREGSLRVNFISPIGASVEAPTLLTVQKLVNGVLQEPIDLKYVVKSISADRKIVEYCFYSATNTNLFNGANVSYVFTLQYDGLAPQVCNPIMQGSPILPVKFSSFSLEKSSRGITLKWETATEENNSGFFVERKLGTSEWTSLDFVPSKSGTGFSSAAIDYSYSDFANFNGIIQYRLKQVDLDGKYGYSEIRSVKLNEEMTGLTVFPNPSKGQISLLFEEQTSLYDVRVVDMSGRTVKQLAGVKTGQEVSGLTRGQYLVMVTNKNTDVTASKKILVQ